MENIEYCIVLKRYSNGCIKEKYFTQHYTTHDKWNKKQNMINNLLIEQFVASSFTYKMGC